jgi:hypothetical protein
VVLLAVMVDISFPFVVALAPADSSILRRRLRQPTLTVRREIQLRLLAMVFPRSYVVCLRCFLLILEVRKVVLLAVVGD